MGEHKQFSPTAIAPIPSSAGFNMAANWIRVLVISCGVLALTDASATLAPPIEFSWYMARYYNSELGRANSPNPECVDRMNESEGYHAEGGYGIPDVADVDACNALCLSEEDCVGTDWNFLENPWMGIHCWLHYSETIGVIHPDPNANHYQAIRC